MSMRERGVKRSMDIVGAMVGIILSTPLVIFAGILIVMDSKGSVFFVQERAGKGGKPFQIIKLRTMIQGAQDCLTDVLAQNVLEGPVFKIPNDPRITRVGRFLRRWSLDELPQFWNVLIGEMSLVGPRPEETWVAAQYDIDMRQRLLFKPGLTGPMQVNGRSMLGAHERLVLELDYILNYSLKKDVVILSKTFGAVLGRRGAM